MTSFWEKPSTIFVWIFLEKKLVNRFLWTANLERDFLEIYKCFESFYHKHLLLKRWGQLIEPRLPKSQLTSAFCNWINWIRLTGYFTSCAPVYYEWMTAQITTCQNYLKNYFYNLLIQNSLLFTTNKWLTKSQLTKLKNINRVLSSQEFWNDSQINYDQLQTNWAVFGAIFFLIRTIFSTWVCIITLLLRKIKVKYKKLSKHGNTAYLKIWEF